MFASRIWRSLFIALSLTFAGTHLLRAENLTLSTYYPSPYGAYTRMRLVPREKFLGECAVGTLYANAEDHSLQYCSGENEKGLWRPMHPVAVERGTLTVFEKDVYSIDFKQSFTHIPLIQIYIVVKDEKAPGEENVMMGNFFSLTGISPEGFSVIHLGSEEEIDIEWIAIGD